MVNQSSEAVVDQNNVWRLDSPGDAGWNRTARAADPNKFFMVSADGHVQEPTDLWRVRMDAEVPRPPARHRASTPTGKQFQKTEGFRPTPHPQHPVRRRGPAAQPVGPHARRNASPTSTADGVDCEIMFPNKGLTDVGDARRRVQPGACAAPTTTGRGKRSARTTTGSSPMACIATGDIDGAIAEIERSAKLGFRGLALPCKPVWGAPDHEALNYNLPRVRSAVGVHPGSRPADHVPRLDRSRPAHVARQRRRGDQLRGALAGADDGADRQPLRVRRARAASRTLAFGSVEAGIGWVPWALAAMDEAYRKHHMWVRPKLDRSAERVLQDATASRLPGRQAGPRPRPRARPTSTTSCGRTTTRTTRAPGRTRPQRSSAPWATSTTPSARRSSASTRARVFGFDDPGALPQSRRRRRRRAPHRLTRSCSERTLRGRVAVVGVGETDRTTSGASRRTREFKLASTPCWRRARTRASPRRTSTGSRRTATTAARRRAVGRARLQGAPLRLHAVGRRWRRRVPARSPTRPRRSRPGKRSASSSSGRSRRGSSGASGRAREVNTVSGEAAHTLPYGLMSAAQMFAMKVNRFMHDHGVEQEALRAISLASYAHAQNNPRRGDVRPAARRTRRTTTRAGSSSRSTCSTAARRTTAPRRWCWSPPSGRGTSPHPPCYVLAARWRARTTARRAPVHNAPDYASFGFKTVAPRLYDMARLGPADVDVLQSYENFTGGVLMSIVEHGFCTPDEVQRRSSPSTNLRAPSGKLPLNTSGGNLAECYMHGLGLNIEAVRQIRGDVDEPGRRRDVSMVISGPMVTPVSACIFGERRRWRRPPGDSNVDPEQERVALRYAGRRSTGAAPLETRTLTQSMNELDFDTLPGAPL